VASRRTGLVFDERCFGHRNPPSGPPWLAVPPFERPERLAATFRALEGSGILRHVERMPARSAPRAALELVHDASHVERVLFEHRSPVKLDHEAWIGPGSGTAALLAVGGMLEAVASVVAGEVDNAFVLARPPGHHAEAGRPMGFCLLNATAVAARWAQLARGAARVAILDWDVHHGNGTEAIFRDDASVLTVSLHQDGLYPTDTGEVGAPGEAIVNVPLPPGTGDAGYELAFERVVEPAIRAFAPDLLLIGAGQDAAASDPLGRMAVTVPGFRAWAERAVALAQECCGGRLVAFLEGGYSLRHLPAANLAILEALAGRPPSFEGDPVGCDVPEGLRDVERAAVEAAGYR
jgi:acetoin utilization deacetylase AcuC-like enzyme